MATRARVETRGQRPCIRDSMASGEMALFSLIRRRGRGTSATGLRLDVLLAVRERRSATRRSRSVSLQCDGVISPDQILTSPQVAIASAAVSSVLAILPSEDHGPSRRTSQQRSKSNRRIPHMSHLEHMGCRNKLRTRTNPLSASSRNASLSHLTVDSRSGLTHLRVDLFSQMTTGPLHRLFPARPLPAQTTSSPPCPPIPRLRMPSPRLSVLLP